MSDFTADFQRILDEEVGNYAARALAQLAGAIEKKGLVLTEDLLKSLRSEVVAASAQHVASMGIAFEQYGRIRDMKGLNRTQAPPIEQIEAFVKKVGVGAFAYIPGYRFGQAPLSQAVAINRIAWGIARAKLRDNSEVKPKAWFAKTFYSSINRFIDALTTRYAAQAGQHIASTLRT
ncbi:hypothetical protein I2I05_19285 [Hymenobacter sp. BT683]|uniref:HK97 gp10 family phage protein n=1 Tax=Hymenobacter jeongseonensis TaxID=2791027 RepID=A0ABS0IME9_9BACT|nr:hypothetical protein [Hymenobacter jeongseonensis]MBF9239545.1 hypothetical protein [Hymenobacter jeongseonensis]